LWWRVDRQERWSGHASVLLVGVISATVVAGRLGKALVMSRFCSFGQRGLSLQWLADRQGHWYGLAFVLLVGGGSVTVVAADSQVRFCGLASDPLVGVV
jgi:hypothetical protein